MGGWGRVFETPERWPGNRGLEDSPPATRRYQHNAAVKALAEQLKMTPSLLCQPRYAT